MPLGMSLVTSPEHSRRLRTGSFLYSSKTCHRLATCPWCPNGPARLQLRVCWRALLWPLHLLSFVSCSRLLSAEGISSISLSALVNSGADSNFMDASFVAQ